MGLETATYIADLVATNPVTGTDQPSVGPAHIRLIKSVIKTSFPNVTGAVATTSGDLGELVGAGTADALTLATGVVENSTDETPKVRKVGRLIVVQGSIKSAATNFSAFATLATIPSGYLPGVNGYVGMAFLNGNALYLYISGGNKLTVASGLTAPWGPISFQFVLCTPAS